MSSSATTISTGNELLHMAGDLKVELQQQEQHQAGCKVLLDDYQYSMVGGVALSCLTASAGLPVNALTDKAYRGINTVSLWACATSKGYDASQWATFKQWQSLGAKVDKGQRVNTI